MTKRRNEGGLAAVILAAGKGTRMNSETAKVLHPLCGKPMVLFPLRLARELGAEKIVLVIGHQAEAVRAAVSGEPVSFARQREQRGTAHAVLQAQTELDRFSGTILILCGDVPLLLPQTVKGLVEYHRESGAHVTVLTALLPDATGYGRVMRDDTGRVLKIVEERDAGEKEKEVREINTGIYCVERSFLFQALNFIGTDNVQREYYLTDIVETAARRNLEVRALILEDYREAMGINTPEQLAEAERIMRSRFPRGL
ncbi:MAG: NTP transferase domain-containing protein [Syntrophales bacterium]|jgi:UDP-N-acetylglucosamine diphosphorylase/glucosamine-1-phosphate N-acetyltransferase|nr:NTP transferase domain-containing protein [Syntrophales bacterium]MCK9527792.1 NTP transferase domain-containing protein [Syntrophales bacterium]MDX9922111.1 NTP transferase domain-containing protein [Syntrophales bacterium]